MENSAMDSERWQNVERLYHATLQCEESQRDAFLTRSCCGDEALRREVESLLSYGNRSAGFIEGSALEVVAPVLAADGGDEQDPASDECRIIKMIGKRISQYRIVEHLGSGGMGEVYRAVRADDQFEKQVAIKLVHAGDASGFVLGRFKKERQILANLNHPNIARLLDGGATEECVPYFVMELVEGQPIDKYCDSHKLGIPVRLQLFLEVCSALQYSHQHQIIHRDIKPANILVPAEGVPKLLDFGIAKILDSSLSAEAVGKTQTAFRAFTPEYASPEQIKAEPINAASDVYSLGVMLYELLSGHRPYRFKTRTPLEIERAICEEEPLKPSTVVTRVEEQTQADGTTTSITPEQISRVRNSDPKRMHNCLLGDLDAIVMMALRKEPHRRYGSVDDLSQDIRKHLDGLPITARPSTITYRGSKFVLRHRELALGALFFLALLVGLAIVRREEVGKPGAGRQREVVRRQLTANAPGDQLISAAISRDGKYLAYSDTTWKIYLLQIDSGELRQLRSSDFAPVDWFPDGNHLLVRGVGRHSGLWKMSTSDGNLRKLADSFYLSSVSPDGSQITYQKHNAANEIWLMGASGEGPHRIAEFDVLDSIVSLAWAPGGQRLVYTRYHGDGEHGKSDTLIETCDPQGGQRTLILSKPRAWEQGGVTQVWWLPDGRILYRLPDPLSYPDYNIWAVAAEPGSGKLLGVPERVANVVGDPENFGASGDGKRFIYMSTRSSESVYLSNLERRAGKINSWRLTLDNWDSMADAWTRDSKAILFQSTRSGRSAILKQRIDQQTAQILLSGAESYQQAMFSPGGDRLLYTASATLYRADASKRIESIPVERGRPTILLPGDYTYHCGSMPSARCVLGEIKSAQYVFSNLDPVHGKGDEIQRLNVQFNPNWSLSPDGNKIAIADGDASTSEVTILTLNDHKVVTLPLQGWKWRYMQSVAWSADASYLFATAYTGKSFVLFSIDPRGNMQVLAEVPYGDAWLYNPVPSPDGHYLAYMKRSYKSNVMMLEHF
jgi:serine/threonine protein kinase